MMTVLVVWLVVAVGGLLVLVPGLLHRRRVLAWERELASAFGPRAETGIIPRRL